MFLGRGDYIESAWKVGVPRITREKNAGRTNQATLLLWRNAAPSSTESVVRSIAYLNENQAVGIKHDQVDFSKTTGEIAFDELDPFSA